MLLPLTTFEARSKTFNGSPGSGSTFAYPSSKMSKVFTSRSREIHRSVSEILWRLRADHMLMSGLSGFTWLLNKLDLNCSRESILLHLSPLPQAIRYMKCRYRAKLTIDEPAIGDSTAQTYCVYLNSQAKFRPWSFPSSLSHTIPACMISTQFSTNSVVFITVPPRLRKPKIASFIQTCCRRTTHAAGMVIPENPGA